ncbi:PAS domain S-box protein [Methanoregula sp.]|jgi:PAS domain S-box-containing protein|uniref:PAS domain S-box protein n=1 Tax=Methanoregula sp. TaxID=2052170 RepID=UPI003C1D2D94
MSSRKERASLSAEARLEADLTRYQLLAESSLDGIIITDFEGRIITANHASLTMFEIDSSSASLPLTIFDFVAPDSLDAVRRDFSGMSPDRKGISRTYSAITARGRKMYIETLGNRIIYEGEPANIISIRDATARHEMEERLRESEYKYRMLAENSLDIINVHTPELRLKYVSPAVRAILGYDPEKLTGHNMLEFIHPNDHPIILQAVDTALSGADTITLIFRVRHREGHYLWFESISHIIRGDKSNTIIEVYNVSRDITLRREAEETAHKRDRVLHGFAVASGFLLTGRLADPIPRVLATVGEAIDADAAYIYEDRTFPPSKKHRPERKFRWDRHSYENSLPEQHHECGERFSRNWSRRLATGVWVAGPKSRFSGPERQMLDEMGIQSILVVPIQVNGIYWGFIGFSDCTTERMWADTEIEILMTLASTLGLVLGSQLHDTTI